MSQRHYVFAGGGTGGHLFPGLAVAGALQRIEPDARVTFLTTTRSLDRELLARKGFEQIEQPVRPWTVNPLRLPRFWRGWSQSVRRARAFLKAHPPRAVLGLGGYAAGPAVVAGRSLEAQVGILSPDATPGRANRYLARHADLIVLQWEVSRRHFSNPRKCKVLGCPIRPEFGVVGRDEGCRRFELDAGRPVLLVTGASQGARTVNQVMQRVWPEFRRDHPEWQLLHLSGPLDETETRAAYAAANAPAGVLAFADEMWLALAAADAVVSRAGASTLAELAALRRPSILLPYPYHRDRHQHANARVLEEAGAAIVVEDRRDVQANRQPVLAALRRLADPAVRESMGRAAARLGRTDAAAQVARWMAE